jgi:hypothetical protein
MSRKGTAAPPAKKGAVKGKGVELDDQLTQCQEILDSIMSKPEAGDFCEPVDWEKLGLTDYPELITHPMDLGTIKVGVLEWRNTQLWLRCSPTRTHVTESIFSEQL